MRFVFLATTLITVALTVSAQNSATPSTPSTDGGILTGCVKGSAHQYYLVEKNGHKHTLMETNNTDLSSYVNHEVTVTGKADTSRVAGSDAEGHRKGYFSVNGVTDQGPCKK